MLKLSNVYCTLARPSCGTAGSDGRRVASSNPTRFLLGDIYWEWKPPLCLLCFVFFSHFYQFYNTILDHLFVSLDTYFYCDSQITAHLTYSIDYKWLLRVEQAPFNNPEALFCQKQTHTMYTHYFNFLFHREKKKYKSAMNK